MKVPITIHRIFESASEQLRMCSLGKMNHLLNEVVHGKHTVHPQVPSKYALAYHCWRTRSCTMSVRQTASIPTHMEIETSDLVHMSEAAASHGPGSALRGWGRMPGPCASGEGASQQIPAKEYAEAGGKLTPPEARALVSCILLQAMQMPCKACLFRGCRNVSECSGDKDEEHRLGFCTDCLHAW